MISVLSNVASLRSQRMLRSNQAQLNLSMERLSTGLKINRAADNPAGLIASENLRSEITGIETAISNATRAGNLLSTAEAGLHEVSSLLIELQSLVSENANAAGLAPEEKQASQLQADAILDTIDRISQSKSFANKNLLDGTYTGSFLIGSKVTAANTVSFSIASTHSSQLGDSVLGKLSSLRSGGEHALTGSSLVDAQSILTASIKQISTQRGELGSFLRYTLDSTINTLQVQLENVSAAHSQIRDTDFADEVSHLTRAQVLTQASTTMLAQANQLPSTALTLLQNIGR